MYTLDNCTFVLVVAWMRVGGLVGEGREVS